MLRGKSDPQKTKIQVAVRVRPFNGQDFPTNKRQLKRFKVTDIVRIKDNGISLLDPECDFDSLRSGRQRFFSFDRAFDRHADNYSVFQYCALPLLERLFDGYNATIFAYGMTGAGKTHTMLGRIDQDTATLDASVKGIIPLCAETLFKKIADIPEDNRPRVRVSFLEIYNEQVIDLLSDVVRHLDINEDPRLGVFVRDLTSVEIRKPSDIDLIVATGHKKRKMASTGANVVSSRSHAVLQFTFQKEVEGGYQMSKMFLIDLAGSERAATTNNTGVRMLEGANINRSLLALGNCINALGDPNRRTSFVPYRDSKLTRLLKDSLGGNVHTMMIANIAPSAMFYDETMNTLKYAERAASIARKVTRSTTVIDGNESQYKEVISALRAEIDLLKTQLARTHTTVSPQLWQDDGQPSSVRSNHPTSSPPRTYRSSTATQTHLASTHNTPLVSPSSPRKPNVAPIEAKIREVEKQSNYIEQQLHMIQKNKDSHTNDDLFDEINKRLVKNFSSRVEIQRSLHELDRIMKENEIESQRHENKLRQTQGELQAQRSMQDRAYRAVLLSGVAKLKQDYESCQDSLIRNKSIMNNLLVSLKENEAEKTDLTKKLLSMSGGTRKSIMELQLRVRQLELDKLRLAKVNLMLQKELEVERCSPAFRPGTAPPSGISSSMASINDRPATAGVPLVSSLVTPQSDESASYIPPPPVTPPKRQLASPKNPGDSKIPRYPGMSDYQSPPSMERQSPTNYGNYGKSPTRYENSPPSRASFQTSETPEERKENRFSSGSDYQNATERVPERNDVSNYRVPERNNASNYREETIQTLSVNSTQRRIVQTPRNQTIQQSSARDVYRPVEQIETLSHFVRPSAPVQRASTSQSSKTSAAAILDRLRERQAGRISLSNPSMHPPTRPAPQVPQTSYYNIHGYNESYVSDKTSLAASNSSNVYGTSYQSSQRTQPSSTSYAQQQLDRIRADRQNRQMKQGQFGVASRNPYTLDRKWSDLQKEHAALSKF